MQTFEIKNRYTDAVIYSGGGKALRDVVVAAVKGGANLGGANLGGADLRGAYLRGADLSDKPLAGDRPILQIGPVGSRSDYLVAYITVSHRSIRIGAYETKEQAIESRTLAEQNYWHGTAKPPPKGALPRNNRSGYVGVHKPKWSGRWESYYGGRGNRTHIGTYATAEEAHAARCEWLKAHGIRSEK